MINMKPGHIIKFNKAISSWIKNNKAENSCNYSYSCYVEPKIKLEEISYENDDLATPRAMFSNASYLSKKAKNSNLNRVQNNEGV